MLNTFEISRTSSPVILKLGIDHLGHKVYKVCINDGTGLTLTCFKTRSNLVNIAYCANYYQAQMSGEPLQDHWSCGVRKPGFCIWENKDADQLCRNRKTDQRLCFRYTDSTIPLLSKSEISSL